jgi:uncharacterized delta-60 repeat protein
MSIANRELGVLVLIMSLTLATVVEARPGDLDPAFGIGGVVATDPGSGFWGTVAGLVDPLGRIVAVGEGGLRDVAVARYLPDGILDASFGSGGIVTVDVPPGTTTMDIAWAVAGQPDGKLVLAGQSGASALPLAPLIVRLNEDGTLDGSFGLGGLVLLPPGGYFYDVALQPDGRIVAAGSQGEDFLIARFSADGTLDPTFGSGGIVTLDLGSEYDVVRTLFLLADERIVVIGSGGIDPEADGIAVARYQPNGTLDASFGADGVVTIVDRGHGFAGAVESDGKVLATSSIPAGTFSDELAVTRLESDGSVDATFGDDGTFHASVLDQAIYYPRVIVQPDGAAVLVASLNFNSSVVYRLADDGTPDVGFAENGSRVFHGRYIWSFGQQALDEKLIGFGAVTSGDSFWNFGLVRLEGGCPPGADTDGDGVPDACDPCTHPTGSARAKLKLARLGSPAGDDVLSATLSGTIPAPGPVADGLRVVLRDASGRVRLDGQFPSLPTTRITPPIAGIDRVRVKTKPNGSTKVRLTGHTGSYVPGTLPLTATVVLDPPMTTTGQCLEAAFGADDCTRSETGSSVVCRLRLP